MPKRTDIHKILVIGSGPIIIGQAAEFDYSGTQACLALREEGYETVLVNSNPATIMTDKEIADHVYIEPLTVESLSRIIRQEYPDAILPTLGGQIGLNLAVSLSKTGLLDELGIELLGTKLDSIDEAEDREKFKELMNELGEPVPASQTVNTVDEAVEFAHQCGYPVIVRPAFTMGGTGGGICHNDAEMRTVAKNGLELSPATQCLIEKSIAGYKEIEFEVMRDAADNVMVVCCMENFDPVGIHTGDSIVFAPNQTLSDREYQMLRDCALKLIRALKIEGGCNVQLALDPQSFHYNVIEVNPRVSRSSALASKATGYPIAKMALEIDEKDLFSAEAHHAPTAILEKKLRYPQDDRLFYLAEAFRRGYSLQQTHDLTKISPYFLDIVKHLVELEDDLSTKPFDVETLITSKKYGFSDVTIARLWHTSSQEVREFRKQNEVLPVYKMIDTCAAEFASSTPYFYSAYDHENESQRTKKPSILVLGSGPIRIGQGVEFDYATVHSVKAIQRAGYEAIVINSNPETVSTDFSVSDKLYFEPLTLEDVLNVIDLEQPVGVIVQFGGQTAINLAEGLAKDGVNILGTTVDDLDAAEDREVFDKVITDLNLKQPIGLTATTHYAVIKAAEKIGYPVLVRPSYVLGGKAMETVYNQEELQQYLQQNASITADHPILIDAYLEGRECEVDAICDGKDVLIPGIMEHIEHAGVHSGDSMAVYPPQHFDDDIKQQIVTATEKLAVALKCIGIMNIQFIVHNHEVYILEVNPRASRTVPFLSKITGIEMAQVATRVILGQSLADQGVTNGLYPEPQTIHVKAPVFSFNKLANVDSYLSPEMKSTGEVMGTDTTYEKALHKAFSGAHIQVPNDGRILFTIENGDEKEVLPLAKRFAQIGYQIFTTPQTASHFKDNGIHVHQKISNIDELNRLLKAGQIDLVINTMRHDYEQDSLGFQIRQSTIAQNVPLMTSLDTVNALLHVKEDQSLEAITIK